MHTKKVLTAAILIGALACGGLMPAQAKQTNGTAADARVETVMDRDADRDEGFDWGLLGLLGLLGLIPRKQAVVHDVSRPNTTTHGQNRT